MEAIKTVEGLVEQAKKLGPCGLVVPAAEAGSALSAAAEGRRLGLVRPILIGDRAGLEKRLADLGESVGDYEIIHEPDDVAAAKRAVALVRAGEAQVILKGRLKTGDLMRAVLDKDVGLRTGRLLSDVLVTADPVGASPRLIGVTDGGLNIAPDVAQKRVIIENAVRVFRRLGFERPRVACLCAIEVVQDAMQHTLDARALTELCERGEIADCVVYGPLALDNALSPAAAEAKGITHEVGGQADILLMPTIEAGNALGKAFTYLAKQPVGHVIEGASAPVLIPSRTESARDKVCSIAIGVLSAQR